MRNPRRLAVYAAARKLVIDVYHFLPTLPRSEDYNLTSQMRRAVTSIRDNLRDGAARQGDRAMLPFLYHAHSSAQELDGHLEQALDVHVGNERMAKRLRHDAVHLAIMLMNFIKKVEADLGIRRPGRGVQSD